jgi:hypothetical protein
VESIVENEKPIEICTHQEATKVHAELFRGLITLLIGKGVLSVPQVMITIKFAKQQIEKTALSPESARRSLAYLDVLLPPFLPRPSE